MSVQQLEAIKKSVLVAAPTETAWELFTKRMGEWWPLETHSLGGDDTETAAITQERIFERWRDGTEKTWGRVLMWDPPRRLVFTWDVTTGSGNEIEVRFSPEGDGTRVDLEHRAWESGTPDTWQSYEEGWGMILGRYGRAAT